ncbi:MAG: chitobiase/beta-hexosaminidase C-terminal domain-containing protein [bacterium]
MQAESVEIYSTGFESSEGFTSSSTYNNTSDKYFGPDEKQWGTIYGTASTANYASGSQGMQMRCYSSGTSYTPYAYMYFDLDNITSVSFYALSSSTTVVPAVKVSYSTDKGVSWTEISTFTLTTSAAQYTATPSETISGSARLRFEMSGQTYASTQRLTIDDVVVYGEPATAPTVATPSFSVEGGDITEATSVEIKCETEGATIYYTTGDVELSAITGTEYTGAITISETTTLRAIAVNDGVSSSVATATYRYLTPMTIAQYIAEADGNNNNLLNDVTVTYQNGSNTWVKDETGSLLIYGSLGNDVDINNGDVITGLKGLYIAYYTYVHEIKEPTYTSIITGGAEIAPEAVEIADLATDDVNKYITISGKVTANTTLNNGKTTFYIENDNDETAKLYTNFSNIEMDLLEGDAIDVVGVVSYYSGVQVYPISIEKQVSTVTSTVTFVDGTTSTDVTETATGSGVTAPASLGVSDLCQEQDWKFLGWSNTQVIDETETAPTILTDGTETYYPQSDITLYAVYQQGTVVPATSYSSPSNEWTVVDETNKATSYWVIFADQYFESPSLTNTYVESVTIQMGTYGGTSDNSDVLQIVNGDDVLATEQATSSTQSTSYTIEINQTLSGSLVFSSQTTSDSKGLRVLSITINTNVSYWSLPVCYEIIAPSTPTFSVAEGTVTAGTKVEINCETEDATIYYTINGVDPTTASTEYTEEIEITTTTTIKAIAVENDMESEIATITYTVSSVTVNAESATVSYDVYANNGVVYVECEAGAKVDVYSILGQRIYSETATSTMNYFNVNNQGVVIVVVDGVATKIAVK